LVKPSTCGWSLKVFDVSGKTLSPRTIGASFGVSPDAHLMPPGVGHPSACWRRNLMSQHYQSRPKTRTAAPKEFHYQDEQAISSRTELEDMVADIVDAADVVSTTPQTSCDRPYSKFKKAPGEDGRTGRGALLYTQPMPRWSGIARAGHAL